MIGRANGRLKEEGEVLKMGLLERGKLDKRATISLARSGVKGQKSSSRCPLGLAGGAPGKGSA